MRKETCGLCNTKSTLLLETGIAHYHKCPNCHGIFMSEYHLPTDEFEIGRYESHNNDVNDPRYRAFVSPITDSVQQYFTENHSGLDFGSGTGPVITTVLRENNFNIETYDPFFDNRPEVLTHTYDYIACCEVVEHFHEPYIEFQRLKSLLKPKGKLFIMTESYHEELDFGKWYYKDDPTHVFFYQKSTFEWIKDTFSFQSVEIKDRLITFST